MKVTPRSRQAWRQWLAKHHAHESEVWLVFYKRHTGKPTLTYNDAVEEAVCFGWIDGIRKSIDDERYTHRFTPRKPDSRWSESNKKRVSRMIEAGLMTAAGTRAVRRARDTGKWAAPARPQNHLSMPKELRDRLNKDDRAKRFFLSLAPSYRRRYIEWIASAKRADTRERRAEEALGLLRSGNKLGMR